MSKTDADDVVVNEGEIDPSFNFTAWNELDIETSLLRGIYGYGFEKPSSIQQQAIKPLIMGRDIVIQAHSGTGKTATFAIGSLANIDLTLNDTQVLVLSPTKELTIQTAKVFTGLGSMMNGLRIKTLYGGAHFEEGNAFSNKETPHIICGCPGKVFDMMRRSRISCKNIKLVILDEADEVLSSGFKDQVYNIFQYFNSTIQVALVSATLPDSINSIIDKIMRNPVRISVKREMLTLEGITQHYIRQMASSEEVKAATAATMSSSGTSVVLFFRLIFRSFIIQNLMHSERHFAHTNISIKAHTYINR